MLSFMALQDLFKYIGRYKPQIMELSTKLKPFIPEFIPAIGGTDEFIKVPRPDGRPDYLGLKVSAATGTTCKQQALAGSASSIQQQAHPVLSVFTGVWGWVM